MKYILRSLTVGAHICPGGFVASPLDEGTTYELTDEQLAAVKRDKRVEVKPAPVEDESLAAERDDLKLTADLPPPEGNGPSSPVTSETTTAPKPKR